MKSKYEPLLLLLTLLLGLFGVLTILSSQSEAERPFFLAARQGTWLVIGCALLAVVKRIPFSFFRKHALAIGLFFYLPLLLLPVFGTRINGMRGWFRFGKFSYQPTEPAKAFFLLTLLPVLCSKLSPAKKFAAALGITALWLLSIGLQPDFGTAAIYFLLFLTVYYLSGGAWRYLLALGAAGAGAATVFIWSHPYALRRLHGFFSPELDPLGSGWHARQFEAAVARGRFFGSKLGQAIWSNAYLPLSYNDSAFATMTETIGLFGALVVLSLFVGMVWTLARMAARPQITPPARLFIMGTAVLIAVQSLVHISVNLSLLPPTGLTLPLISYGGSSLVGCFLLIAMALSAGRDCDPEPTASPEPTPKPEPDVIPKA